MSKKESTEQGEKRQLSYDELKTIAGQLQEQNKFLIERLRDSEMTSNYKKLDYMFAIVSNSEKFDDEFVSKVIAEIQGIFVTPEITDNDGTMVEGDN